MVVSGSSSGSTASLLGWGVNCDFRDVAENLSLSAGFRGEVRSGKVVVEVGVGVFVKNPCSVRCPAPEPDFFSVDGVGVDDADFLVMFLSYPGPWIPLNPLT